RAVCHRPGRFREAGAGNGLRRRAAHPLRRQPVSPGHRLARPAPRRLTDDRRAYKEATMSVPISLAYDYFTDLQARIVRALEEADGASFRSDSWTRDEGGGGLSPLLGAGARFDPAGVPFRPAVGGAWPP